MLQFAKVRFALVLLAAALGGSVPAASRPLRQVRLPNLMLWAWERPEDLTFIDKDRVGIAYLAGTIRLSGDHVVVAPRRQPLRRPAGTALLAVVRIESDPSFRPRLGDLQLKETLSKVLLLTSNSAVRGVQLDFDALVSERDFYRKLIAELRGSLPKDSALSMTALTSWCLHDTWIETLPVDEIVPMVFRMGPDGANIRQYFNAGGDFRLHACRDSIGVSTDEMFLKPRPGRRLYAFHPVPWTKNAFDNLQTKVGR